MFRFECSDHRPTRHVVKILVFVRVFVLCEYKGRKELMKLMPHFAMFAVALFCSDLHAATSPKCPGEEGYIFTNNRETNPTKGGFVGYGAYVSESAFIAPTAAVCGSATVEYGVRLMGNAVVKDEAMVDGKVRIMGNAIVGGTAMVSGSGSPTIIKGYARIMKGEITSGRHGSSEMPRELKEQKRKAAEFSAAVDIIKGVLKRPFNKAYSQGNASIRRSGSVEINEDCHLNMRWELQGSGKRIRWKSAERSVEIDLRGKAFELFQTASEATSMYFYNLKPVKARGVELKIVDYGSYNYTSEYFPFYQFIKSEGNLISKGDFKKLKSAFQSLQAHCDFNIQ